ncbi:MAG: nitrogen regulation protein NR(II) [Vicinamibacterales bacterium]
MKTGSLGERLSTHIAVRLMLATVFLGAAIVVQVRTPGAFPGNPLFLLIALVYAVSLVSIASLRLVDRFPRLVDVHFAIDATLIAACVFLTGGITSLFSSLFGLPILAAGTMQRRRGALQAACVSSALFAAVVLAQYAAAAGLIGLPTSSSAAELPDAILAFYTVGLNIFGFFAVALLGGSLAERLRKADVRLEQASEKIADLQAFNQYVIDNLVSGLATADEQNHLLTFNRSAVLITGQPLGSVVGRPAHEVLQLPAQVAATLEEDLMRMRIRRIDYEHRHPEGRILEIGLSATQLPLPDGRRGFMYTFQDVTDVKRLERQAQLRQRMAAVGEMAAGIAHEIRNPLASMSGSMQILRQELELSPDQSKLLDIVLRESERLNETIRSFLAYARPQRLAVQHLDLRRVVRDAATLLRNSPEVGERHVVEVVDGPRPVMVEVDENQMRQIVWNLASNALRAMPHGGRLTLSTLVERQGEGTDTAMLLVRDEGVGIARADVESIFQPFRGAFGKGTGLGLAIVHRIVSGYNGRIDVQSTPGQGTTFRVAFPAVRPVVLPFQAIS